jgi:hypothetical protein
MADSITCDIIDHSLTIPEFCRAERISVAAYYNLNPKPDEMRHGRSVRISAAARKRWQEQREKASAA